MPPFDEALVHPASCAAMKRLSCIALILAAGACTPNEPVTPSTAPPPEPTAEPSTKADVEPAPPADPSVVPAEPKASAVPVTSAPPLAPQPQTETPPPVPEQPALHADDGSVLPQTKDQPTTDSAIYEHHVRLLFRAIVEDDPELARPFFFPLVAYEQVKAIEKPAWDWNNRLWKLFVRDIHAYHEQLGDDPQGAKLERIVLREPSIRWMKPHSEGNRLGYYRITRSRIQGTKADGSPIDFELTSMISWRGEWYVVHLHGFR